MKTDAVVLGAELDGLVAAIRLVELGRTVRVLMPGAGSLHYAPSGIHVLGYLSDDDVQSVSSPLARVSELGDQHPYCLAGVEGTHQALDWFFETAKHMDLGFSRSGDNVTALTPAAVGIPVYAPARHQATQHVLVDKAVGIIRFRGHRDFPAGLIAAELTKSGLKISVIEVDAPCRVVENVVLAQAFDELVDPEAYFRALKARLPMRTEVIVFPAVLGLRRHAWVTETAATILEAYCVELPTLPPSVPGIRLHQALENRLIQSNVMLHRGVGWGGVQSASGRCAAVIDDMGRSVQASVFVVATGGVLMGGLEVESNGHVRETVLGLDVFQSGPLDATTLDGSLQALHGTGVETDASLRPSVNGAGGYENVFVTGRTLAHWNPAAEASAEGVSIVTGWLAAQSADHYLKG